MTNHEVDKILEQFQAGLLSPIDQLNLCRRKVKNIRQTAAMNAVINTCIREPLAIKYTGVILNTHAMLHFASLPDDVISNFMELDIKRVYDRVFIGFGLDYFERESLIEARGSSFPTTVESNGFIELVTNQAIDRINSLPVSEELKAELTKPKPGRNETSYYNYPDIRERAILYFASLSGHERISIINENSIKYGFLLTRLTDSQYNKKLQNVRF